VGSYFVFGLLYTQKNLKKLETRSRTVAEKTDRTAFVYAETVA